LCCRVVTRSGHTPDSHLERGGRRAPSGGTSPTRVWSEGGAVSSRRSRQVIGRERGGRKSMWWEKKRKVRTASDANGKEIRTSQVLRTYIAIDTFAHNIERLTRAANIHFFLGMARATPSAAAIVVPVVSIGRSAVRRARCPTRRRERIPAQARVAARPLRVNLVHMRPRWEFHFG